MAKSAKKRDKKYNQNAATFKKVNSIWESIMNRFVITTIDKFSPRPFFIEEFITRLNPQESEAALIRFTNFCYQESNTWFILFVFGTPSSKEGGVDLTPVKMTIKDVCLYDVAIMFSTLLEQAKLEAMAQGCFKREDLLGYGYMISPEWELKIDETELSLCNKVLTETENFTKFRDMDDYPVTNDVIMGNIEYVIQNAKRIKYNIRG